MECQVTDDYCLPHLFIINNRQLNQDLDKFISNFKNKQKYTQANVVHLSTTARNKTQEVCQVAR